MKTIVVSSNCTTGPIADHLRCIFPNFKIHAIPIIESNYIDKIFDLVQDGGHLIFYSAKDFSAFTEAGILNNNICIKIPFIYFNSFHPDLVYCKHKNDGHLTSPHYNSRIALFGYENNLCADEIVKLFNHSIYKGLGYYNLWDSQREQLKAIFLEADLAVKEFDIFFNNVQRDGVFMHSINHPNISTVKQLIKILIKKYDPSIRLEDYTFNLSDGLINAYVFPVYPEVAENLGLKGNYSWSFIEKGNKHQFNKLYDYVEFMLSNYERSGFPSDALSYQINDSQRKFLTDEVTKL